MKNIKTKKKYLYHLGNFNSPLVDKPRLGPGPESNIVCAVLFGCWQYFDTSPLPLFVLVSVTLEIS